MRVLVLTHRLPYAPNRGDRIRAYHLVRQLATRMDVDLVSLTHDADEEAHAADLRGVVSRMATARVPRMRNLARGALALPTSRPLTHSLLDSPRMRTAIAEMVAEQPPDIVLAYCSGVARYALEAPLRSIPAIVDMVDVDSEKWRELAKTSAPLKRWIYRRERRTLARFEAAAARHARATLVVNERERASLLSLAPETNVRVIPNGIDLAAFHADTRPSDAAAVIFCGVMNYSPNERGARWLAESVWPIVRRHHPHARLLLVGADPTSAVRSLAENDPSIEVTGTVPDVRPFLWRSAVAAAPLQTARGIQNKVLEAIASGLPTVVTPVVFDGLPREAAAACAVAESPDAFAAAIVDLLRQSPAERRARASRADLGALGWREQIAPLFQILEDAISTPRLRPSTSSV
jgi:sugar transferase (PEP-CTERM/EpsH1 system associated)